MVEVEPKEDERFKVGHPVKKLGSWYKVVQVINKDGQTN
jgi:hypothetical protein